MQAFLVKQGIHLQRNVKVPIGINGKKDHSFDLGDPNKKIIVECESHTWTETGNVPSAKITAWVQASYFFHAAPTGYRKIMFVLRDFSEKRDETLGQYFLRTSSHLVPADVEFWEFDETAGTATRLK